MKWLVVLFALFMHGQLSAVGLCKKTDQGVSNNCIAGWNGATDQLAYAGALSAMIDKLGTVIVYDSYANHGYWFGLECKVDPGYPATEEDPAEPPGGCTRLPTFEETINVPQATAFQKTLRSAHVLIIELNPSRILTYRGYATNVPEKNDKTDACNSMNTYLGIAQHWNNFATAFQQDYDAFNDRYRKKIFKNYFQAIKRLYGFYANRMKRLMKNVKREYRCEA